MKDLDQLEDEATAMRSVYLEGGSRGVWGSAPPTKICPVFPEANFALPESCDPKNANPCVPAKEILKDLDQLEDEATAMRSVYLEGGSRGVWGSAPPTKICPVFPEANFALPESCDPKNANPCVPGKGDFEGFRPTGR